MKTINKIISVMLMQFPLLSYAAHHPAIYVVKEADLKNTIQVEVHHPTDDRPTFLALRRSVSTVASQVEAVSCDGNALTETDTGVWLVPAHCALLQWRITFVDASSLVAAKQQSMISGHFKLLSEASSLPRLLNADGDDALKMDLPYHTVFPAVNRQGLIPLSSRTAPPLFVLMNAAPLNTLTSEDITLNYWMDHRKDKNDIPDERAEMHGLEWMNQQLSHHHPLVFSVAWLGLPKELLSMGGATGSDVLLTNYSNDGDINFGKSMMLYIALHEGFHEFTEAYAKEPTWAAESLASYFGVRATMAAMPDGGALMQHFEVVGTQFSDGLLLANEKVGKGDPSDYVEFYTKGIAFWDAVDQAMRVQGDSLDHHLVDLLNLQYDSAGNPLNLQTVCHLSPNVYSALRKQYLA
jgi:hypothetical protein